MGFESEKLRFAIVMTDNFSIDSILSSKNEIDTGTFTVNLTDADITVSAHRDFLAQSSLQELEMILDFKNLAQMRPHQYFLTRS